MSDHQERVDFSNKEDASSIMRRDYRLGAICAFAYFGLSVLYGLTLILGLATLESPDDPIGDPHFTIMELIILIMAPLIVCVFAVIHQTAVPDTKVFSRISLMFATLLAGLTACVHFVILTVSREDAVLSSEYYLFLFSFEWPSVAYALDILAWDVFFSFAVLFAIPAIRNNPLNRSIRALLLCSGILALAGLSGVAANNMALRNIGILGYVGTFSIAMYLLGLRFLLLERSFKA